MSINHRVTALKQQFRGVLKAWLASALCGAALVCAMPAVAQNLPNPILRNVADIGVMKHNGKYYLGGCRTDGNFYVSDDLVHWSEPIHVIDMNNDWTRGTGAGNNQIHANDMMYHNGVFHAYWSVNYWGRDRHAVHITHATASNPLGPYDEPVKDTWMDNRIDPCVFRDADGRFYMYMVRFTDGNAIWCRPMKSPWEFAGDPVLMFSSQPGTWETMDNRVAEGPWVMRYRGQYYMMYNANHTGSAWGNYQLGVAQASSPMGFNTGNKYSHPVLGSNQTAIDERYVDLLRYSAVEGYSPLFSYTTTAPDAGWDGADCDDSAWKRGECGFGSQFIEGSTVRHLGTEWKHGERLWLRKAFTAPAAVGNLALRVTHEGDTRILLNGKVVYDKKGSDYCIVNLTADDRKALVAGRNVLAVETSAGRRSNYFNVALFDMCDSRADEEILSTPGQPNIVRGVNGWEWWLVYMANHAYGIRDQYVDRVHFFDRKMWVEGITGPHTAGYHPVPAKPTCAILDETAATGVLDGAVAADAYLIETNVCTDGDAGVIAWHVDGDNCARVGIDSKAREWYLSTVVNGCKQCRRYPLPADFVTGVYHSLRVERYGSDLKVEIDRIPAPVCSEFAAVIPAGKAVAGLFDADGSKARFEGTIYTIGFDDHAVTLGNGEENLFGEALADYELSFQLYGMDRGRKAAFYPAYADSRNYVRASLDGDASAVIIEEVERGKVVKSRSLPLAHEWIVYPDVKYSDGIEQVYRFDSPTWLSAIKLNRHDSDRHSNFVDNMFSRLDVAYLSNGKWHSIGTENAAVDRNPMYNRLEFPDVKADALRFINHNPQDTRRHIYKIGVEEKLRDSYNLRATRRGNELHLWLDGRELCTVDLKKMPASRVGFTGCNYFARYSGILYYHIGK